MFTLLLIASNFFLVNQVIAARMLPPPSLISDSHSVRYPHTLSPLNDGGSHGSTLYPPSMMMSNMAIHFIPLNYDGSLN